MTGPKTGRKPSLIARPSTIGVWGRPAADRHDAAHAHAVREGHAGDDLHPPGNLEVRSPGPVRQVVSLALIDRCPSPPGAQKAGRAAHLEAVRQPLDEQIDPAGRAVPVTGIPADDIFQGELGVRLDESLCPNVNAFGLATGLVSGNVVQRPHGWQARSPSLAVVVRRGGGLVVHAGCEAERMRAAPDRCER